MNFLLQYIKLYIFPVQSFPLVHNTCFILFKNKLFTLCTTRIQDIVNYSQELESDLWELRWAFQERRSFRKPASIPNNDKIIPFMKTKILEISTFWNFSLLRNSHVLHPDFKTPPQKPLQQELLFSIIHTSLPPNLIQFTSFSSILRYGYLYTLSFAMFWLFFYTLDRTDRGLWRNSYYLFSTRFFIKIIYFIFDF